MKKILLALFVVLLHSLTTNPVSAVQCSGAPNAGTASTLSPAAVCPGENLNFTLTGFTADSGISLQWQIMPLALSTWINPGGNDSSATFTITALGTSTAYRCVVTCNNSGLSDSSNVLIIYTPGIISVDNDTVCSPGNVDIIAHPIGRTSWFVDNITTTVLHLGDTLNANVSNDTIFYVENSYRRPARVGPVNNSFASGGNLNNYSQGLIFTTQSDFILDTVFIYPNGTGTVRIVLTDTITDMNMDSTTFIVNSSMVGQKTPVPLNWSIPSGHIYFIRPTGTTIASMYRNNSGAVYPFTYPGTVSIVGNTAGPTAGAFYYYFYDWRLHWDCTSARSPLPVHIGPMDVNVSATADSICLGGNVTLSATGGTSYSWAPVSMTGSSIVISPTSTDTYTVTGTASLGCSDSANIQVIVNFASATIASAPDTFVCSGAATTLNATGGLSYSWAPGGLTGATVITNPVIATTYTVTGTNSSGCTSTDTLEIDVDYVTVTATASPYAVCIGNSTTLNASGTGLTYVWAPGGMTGNNVNVTPSMTTVYTVTATNSNTCTGKDTAMVQLYTANISVFTSNDTICPGDTAILSAVGGVNYVWNPGLILGPSISVSPTSTTTYTVVATNSLGCNGTGTITVNTDLLPIADFTFTNIGGTYTFTNTTANGFTYNWDFGDSLISFATNPVFSFSSNGLHYVTLIATNACGSDTVVYEITVSGLGISSPDDNNPVTISPNPGRGIICIRSNSESTHAILEIRNTLGELILRKNNINNTEFVDMSSHANGIYFWKWIADGNIRSGKLVLTE